MLSILLLGATYAQTITTADSPPDRRYKVEAYSFAPLPATNLDGRWNLDWRETELEFWSAILECSREGKNVDKCTFADNRIEFGYIVQGESTAKVYELPADFWLEVGYNKKGQAKPFAKGDGDAFWEMASNALIGRFHKPEGRAFKPDSWREIGTELEDTLRYWLAGALEFQGPRGGDASKGWRASAPLIAQTWSGGAYNGTMDLQVTATNGSMIDVSGGGRFAEMHPTRSSWATKGQCHFSGTFDQERGIPVAGRTEIAFAQTAAGYYTRRITVMREAQEGDTWHAGELPGTPFSPM